mgnify:CR=1 FL=1
MLISIVIPVYNEQENIPVLCGRLFAIAKEIAVCAFEFIFVDDHSQDDSFGMLKEISAKDKRVKLLKFSKNFGSHIACVAGLSHASGDAAITMSADMQEPPELIPLMINKWKEQYGVVWAVREEREEPYLKVFLAKAYYRLMKKIALKEFPLQGSDMFLIDRKVIDVVVAIKEKNTSLFGLICWSGFKQASIPYKREKRKVGKSKWTISKQIKLAVDSFVSFSYLPIRLSSYAGFLISFTGFLYALFIIVRYFFYKGEVAGWSSLMVVLLIVSGIQLLILGILGEYLWRSLEESRKRPLFIIEEKAGFNS